MHIYIKLGTVIAALFLLQSCADVAMTGAQVVYNRHRLEKNFHDQYITMRCYQALNHKTDEFKNANIVIATLNNEVLLTGQVPEPWQKAKAEQIVKKVPSVQAVHNLLAIASPSSSLIRISDSWITAKIKAKLIASSELDASQIKVVTENGTVYLMGTVKPEEAETAVKLANNTEGVQSVEKLFWYLRVSRS